MSRVCACGADHEADRLRGAERERASRCERWGVPFETIAEGALHQPIELRATQTDGGAWEATVYAPQYEALAGCEVGGFEFIGLAATEGRAQALARQAAATAIAKWSAWREKWERERAERAVKAAERS